MKKTYAKPQIAFESFTLCSSIAAGCAVHVNTAFAYTCGIDYPGVGVLFNDQIGGSGCGFDPKPYENDGLCYHGPYTYEQLFNS